MATVKSIKSSGGDYTSISAWEAAISPNPTEDQTASIEEDFNADVFTLDVSNSNNVELKITAASGYRFYQKSQWATSTYAVLGVAARCTNGSSFFRGFYTSNCIVEFIEYQGVAGAHYWTNTGGNVTFKNCLIHSSDVRDSGGTLKFRNCFFVLGMDVIFDGGSWTFTNCTFNSMYWRRSGGTFNNCVSVNPNTNSCYPGSAGGNYNLSSDSSAPGANSWVNQPTSVIVSTTSSAQDLHRATAYRDTYIGTNESGTIGHVDIDGETILSGWQAGADRKYLPAVTPIPNNFKFVKVGDGMGTGERVR